MKKKQTGIFRRIGLLIFFVIIALSFLFVMITYRAADEFYQASTQLLNKNVAKYISQYASPYSKDTINRKKADSVFYSAMIISPNVEIYVLDTTGKIMYYRAPDSLIKLKRIPLTNIHQFLKDPTQVVRNLDPKDPATPKIFSAAEAYSGMKKVGYIYVILVSKKYRNVAEFVFKSRLGGWATKVTALIILTTAVFSLLYTFRLQKRFNKVIQMLEKFKEGDLAVRFDVSKKDEFYPVSDAFNSMVDMLSTNLFKLKALEGERKNFLANIAHDLRTPLSVARGYAETILMEKNEHFKEREPHLEMVLAKIMQVEKLVLQLFELSRMEAVNFRPVKDPFVFSEVLQELLKGAEMQARQKEIQISCANCQDNALVNADISMMERVLQNLLENAIKYTDHGGYIRVSLNREPGYLIVTIENSGKQLSDNLMVWINDNMVEEAIYRPDHIGLGLALVKRILQLHHFSLRAETKEGAVNCFILKIDIFQRLTTGR